LIVGLRSQGVEAFEAAAMGAWIHGQAGLKISQEIGTTASVLAGDILTGIIKVMKDLAPGSINPMHDSSGPDL
jgi:NAD(P)H-hydrate repair Nnr-like enzyme with NAD(P)H-hydrate dehydratase domain